MRKRSLTSRLEVFDERTILTRQELLAAGIPSSLITRGCTVGELVRVHRAVYCRGVIGGYDAIAAATCAVRGVASHDSAAQLWSLDLAYEPSVHVTVDRHRSHLASATGVRLHRVDLPGRDVEERLGIRATAPLRTVLDCSRTLELRFGVAVADSALRSGLVTLEELHAEASAARGPGSTRARRVAELADPASGSALESMLRVRLTLAGLAPSHSQYVVRDVDGHLVGVADFCYLAQRLLIEADGFAFHSQRSDVRRDRRKTNGYALAGWRLLRFSWEDVLHDEAYVVATVAAQLARPITLAA